jgi:hypothetical protein
MESNNAFRFIERVSHHPLNLFVVTVITSAASFYAHVFFDKEYHGIAASKV